MSLFGGSVLLESENFLAGLEKAAGHQNQPGDYCTGFGKQFAGPADFFTGPVFFYAGSAFSIADVRVFFRRQQLVPKSTSRLLCWFWETIRWSSGFFH